VIFTFSSKPADALIYCGPMRRFGGFSQARNTASTRIDSWACRSSTAFFDTLGSFVLGRKAANRS